MLQWEAVSLVLPLTAFARFDDDVELNSRSAVHNFTTVPPPPPWFVICLGFLCHQVQPSRRDRECDSVSGAGIRARGTAAPATGVSHHVCPGSLTTGKLLFTSTVGLHKTRLTSSHLQC